MCTYYILFLDIKFKLIYLPYIISVQLVGVLNDSYKVINNISGQL